MSLRSLAADQPSGSAGPANPGMFVTGTGTGVGKTVVAAVLAHTLAAQGRKVAVFKPAVTGLDPESRVDGPETGRMGAFQAHRPDHEVLRLAAGSAQTDEEIAPYRYGPPASPHLAAELAGESIDPERLLAAARAAGAGADILVCEGIGGLLVPITPEYLVRDFAAELGLPIVIAASAELGTINHTLLTIEAARAAGLTIAAIVLTPWPAAPNRIEESNRETIANLGEVAVLSLPPLDLSNPAGWPELSVPPRL
ncbi:MAG: dethiobiotin synthase [Solirubrobacterales bacterium]